MAYAAVISLKYTIYRLQNLINFPRITNAASDEELDSLQSMLEKLDDESSRMIDRSVINGVDAKIRDAVWKLEDVLDKSSLNISSSQGGLDEKGVEEEMNSFSKKVRRLKMEYYRVLRQKRLPAEEEYATLSLRRMRREYRRELRQKPLLEEEEEEEEEDDDEALSLSAAVEALSLSAAEEEEEEEEEEDEALSLSAAVPPENSSTTVGLSNLSQSIIDQLLRRPYVPVPVSERSVSLVGMAGIGKTHLAALIYHHPSIVQHFHVRLWVRAGPKYQPSDIYADILSQLLHQPRDLFKEKSENKLIDLLHENLGGGRFFILLDDVWTTRVLNFFIRLHCDHRTEIQILITTRLQEVAERQCIHYRVYQIPFLNDEESWNLLWQNVFVAEKSFPSQLEKPGRKIAEKCEGLPLLILAVADILRGLDKTEEYWMKVAENKTTTFTDAYENIYKVLLPSYEYLPQHLKPCFLYMGVFPQSFQIRTSRLFNLWAVEDFLEPILSYQYRCFLLGSREQKLEEFANECVEDLVSKSLAIVSKQRFCGFLIKNRKIKSLKLHSAYWYVSVKEARKSNFLHVLNKLTDVFEDSIEKQRRLSVQNNILFSLKEVYDTMAAATSTTRSLLCTGEDHQYPVRICFDVMLLMRVLDALSIRFYEFPNEVLKLLQLRYLSLTHNGELPSSISNLQQLQSLILRRHHNIKYLTAPTAYLPDEIWDMEELGNLRIMGSNLPDPTEGKKLSKLLTLHVNAHSCSEAIFRGIPHLKKLGITIELEPDAAAGTVRCLEHIWLLRELQSLKCVVVNPRLKSSQLAVAPPDHLSNLPKSLKKLSLNGLGYPWKYMSVIGSLPKLKVLKLQCSAFQGPHWETEAGQFGDLVHWTAEDNCFRKLQHLSVRHCYKLKKIPLEIGYLLDLKMMEVDDCSPSVGASAHQLEEKRNSANEYFSNLEVVINSSWNL